MTKISVKITPVYGRTEAKNGKVTSYDRYVLSWDYEGLPGEWNDEKASIVLEYLDGKFHHVTRWHFPIKFYDTREYFMLMSSVEDALMSIEKAYEQKLLATQN